MNKKIRSQKPLPECICGGSLNASNLELSKTLVIKHTLISMPTLSERLLKGNNFKPFKKYFCEFKKRSTVSESKKAAFTLAETMIVLIVLGVIATLTVPNLINKQRETTQRTKVKKAMAMYETAVNKMILENDRSFSGLNEAGCNKTIAHFKYIKRDSNNGCIFQTSDKIWWDLTDIQRPIISFKEITSANREDVVIKANTADDKTAFVMVGRFDDNGILRVDDLGYESTPGNSQKDKKGYESKDQLEKLYGFLNNKTAEAPEEVCIGKCSLDKVRSKVSSYPRCQGDNRVSCYTVTYYSIHDKFSYYDENSKNIYTYNDWFGSSGGPHSNMTDYTDPRGTVNYNNCDTSGNNCASSTVPTYTVDGRTITPSGCDGEGVCSSSTVVDSNDPRGTVNYSGCDGNGNNCASSTVPTYTVDGRTITPSGCDGNGVCSSSTVAPYTLNGGTIYPSGCDGNGVCTSSTVHPAYNPQYPDLNYYGCDGNGNNCTSSSYISGGYNYNCDGNLQNCSLGSYVGCLARGTMITLADGSKKAIQDIDFDDELSVWDFDNGHLSSAKPLWIKIAEVTNKYNLLTFSDGRTLKTINQHRIFNKEAGKYTYPMTDDTPLGTTTLLEDGSEVTLVKKEVIEEPVEFYNIMTKYHFNCFANEISTSNRFNNLYPIKDYKFVKEEREVVPYEEYKQIPYEWYEKMRLAEQPREVNRDGADKHANSIANHILNLYIATNKRKPALV